MREVVCGLFVLSGKLNFSDSQPSPENSSWSNIQVLPSKFMKSFVVMFSDVLSSVPTCSVSLSLWESPFSFSVTH